MNLAKLPERYGIGGSQAAAAVGLHPHCPPIQLWCELVGEAEPFEGNRFTKWGALLESPIRQEYAERNGVVVRVPETSQRGWKRASPDGVVYVDERMDATHGLEVKTGDRWTADRWGEEGTDEIPIEYLCQGAWYMHLTELPRWDFAVLLGGNDYREYRLDRDTELEAGLVEGVERFWVDHVLARKPPPPDASSAYKDWLARRSPHLTDRYLEGDAIADELVGQLMDVVRDIASLSETERLLKNTLAARIGEASGLITPHGKITYRSTKGRSTTDWESIGRELADQVGLSLDERLALTAKHTKEGKPYRAFRRPNTWTKEK